MTSTGRCNLPPQPPRPRLGDSLDTMRQEFDLISQELNATSMKLRVRNSVRYLLSSGDLPTGRGENRALESIYCMNCVEAVEYVKRIENFIIRSHVVDI